jgi:hypothetical protein
MSFSQNNVTLRINNSELDKEFWSKVNLHFNSLQHMGIII